MYTLLSGLYKYMFQKDEYCILILGLDNAGKTVRLVKRKNNVVLLVVVNQLKQLFNTLRSELITFLVL